MSGWRWRKDPSPGLVDLPALPRIPWRSERSVFDDPEAFGYRIYTIAHDEVVQAEDLMPPEHLDWLARIMDERLAIAVCVSDEPRLGAVPMQTPSRLTEMLAPLLAGRATEVVLLIDNSGSLREPESTYYDGKPVAASSGAMLSIATATVLGDALHELGVGLEVLGYTTRSWHGGRSREDWIAAGMS